MNNKYFKFHFKNDVEDKVSSYNVDLDNFTEALEFAYNKLDELNSQANGYRIVGVYEILTERKAHVLQPKTN